MKKKQILCIIGHSGSGKTTIELTMEQFYPGMFHRIVSYTTRPMREGEKDGVEHHFVQSSKVPDKSRMLAYTRYGGYEYWADTNDVWDNIINTYVIDVEGYRFLKRYYGDQYDIRVMYVKRTVAGDIDQERRDRDNGREELSPDEIDVLFPNEGSKADFCIILASNLYTINTVFNRWQQYK